VPGVTYEISGPRGLLRVAPLGTRKIPAMGSAPVFVVRYYIENKSNQYWRIEPELQTVAFGAEAARAPSASSLDRARKVFEAKAGQTQVFDLIYAVPAGDPVTFALDWQIEAAGQAQKGRAAFEKAEIPAGSLEGSYVEQNVQVIMLPNAGGMSRSVQ
jgi:hypothetical protein